MESVASQGRLIEGFKRLFPKFDASRIVKPLQTELMVAMCNIVQYAFGAYESPEVNGFTEHTSQKQQVQHLNYTHVNAAVEGVLKIHLKHAKSVKDSDYGWWDLNDPYVVFSNGSSCVKSTVIKDAKNPVWNSTHYLIVRKEHIQSGYDGKMHIALFDSDKHSGSLVWTAVANYVDEDDFLGAAQIDLSQLKRSGVQSFDLALADSNGSIQDNTSLSFTTEFITFKAACEEMGIPQGGPSWMKETTTARTSNVEWSDLTWVTEFGKVNLDPLAFIEVPSSDTQAWLYVNDSAKILLVAFRAYRTSLTSTRQDGYCIRATDGLKADSIGVHNGFLHAYESIREALLQAIYDATKWGKDWDICFTGHSLGGALSTLATFEVANRKNDKGEGPVVGMMSFGAPRVGNRAFAESYNTTAVETFRVVDKQDIVHLVPPFYTHTAKELLCLPNGVVLLEGVPLVDQTPIDILTNTRPLDAEVDDSGSLEEILRSYGAELDDMADKHRKENYFAIIKAAAKRFAENFRRKSIETTIEA